MSPAITCVADTLRLLLDEARQAGDTAASKRGQPDEAFEVGRSQALIETLHTWVNQVQTFGFGTDLGPVWDDLRTFLAGHGY